MLCMPRVTRHLRVGLILVLLVILSCVPLRAGAATTPVLSAAVTPKIFITELQTSGSSASEEFVELFNTTGVDIDLADVSHAGKDVWKLQFFSATSIANGAPDWTKPAATVSLSGTIPAHGYYLLAGTGYNPGGIDSDQYYGSRLSDTGGGLQLVTASSTAITYFDRLMWKQEATGLALPASVLPTPAAKSSLQRLPNDDSEYMNAAMVLTDFTSASDISPKDTWHAPAPVTAPGGPADSSDPSSGTGEVTTPEVPADPVATADNTGLSPPYITELLPNPASPLKDETDEFIELYNPNTSPYNLKGFALEVGTSTLHDFTFAEGVVLAPESYTVFYSVDTKLSLTNTGGQARLMDATGIKISETLPYAAADDGSSWSFGGDTWQWSTTPSPNAANVITLPVVPVKTASSTASKAAAKPTAAKATAKTAAAKVKGTTTTKAKKTTAKATKKKAAKTKAATVAQTKDAAQPAPIHTGVLVAVVALAVLYAAYEYRHDLSNRIFKLRHNRAVRAYARQ
jgi:hypothetical protein